jgi:hypothetical protein
MDGGERLQELFLALFDSDAELRRFFALYGFLSPQALPPGESLRSGTLQAARTLRENGQINEALFDALEERSPGRRPDIREVARFYGAGASPPGPAPSSAALPGNEVPPELADFARQLLTDLDALQIPDDAARVVDPDRWPWTAVAAVLGSFKPTALHPLPGSYPLDSALLELGAAPGAPHPVP